MLVQLREVGRRIGGRWLFRQASLVVRAGDRIGLVGPNGAGKSTLLRVVAGDEAPDAGQVSTARGARLGMLRQEIDPRLSRTVQQEAASALEKLDALECEIRELEAIMADTGARDEHVPAALAERYDRTTAAFEHAGGFGREARVARVLAGLGFDEAARERPLHSFSGGWLMRVELAKLFLAQPDVLLLDEPTNHLDLPAIRWFEEAIEGFPGGLIVVSHDRTFLRRHVQRVVELDGHGRFTLYEADYERYLQQREERHEQLLARKANQDREIAQMERFVERFRAKSTKARQAQSRIRALERIERIEVTPRSKRSIKLRIPAPARSGECVVRLAGIHKAYGENRIYSGIDFELSRGERVALAGPNGAGKSTLLRIAAGALDFDSGERTLGHNVHVAFFAQHQLEALDTGLSVLEELSRSADTDDIPRLRGHLGAFLFSGDDVDKKIGVLSGGEKTRVALAKLLLRPANLLVLDEPTNHLDIRSCEVLERALQDYRGTLLFVSHDRAFINALATRVVKVAHGALQEFIGNYDDYLFQSKRLAEGGRKAAAESVPAAPADAPRAAFSKAERQQQRQRRKVRDRTARRIERIEREIHEREGELGALDWKLGDPDVYSRSERIAEIQAEQARMREAIDTLYAEWERLSDELASLDDVSP